MTINYPASQQVIFDRMVSDTLAVNPDLNPSIRGSLVRAIIASQSFASFEQFTQIQILQDQMFVNTASGVFLEIHGSIRGITRNQATQASGFITASGVAATTVPLSTLFSSSDGNIYETQSEQLISAQTLSVTSINRTGSTATAITISNHNLASGTSVTISGAGQIEYNGTFTIIVTNANEFTYTVTGTPTTPATGTLISSFTTASIDVISQTTGLLTNQNSGASLSVSIPVAGMNDTAFVQFGDIGGGSDLESDDNLRTRILDSFKNPVSLFNVAQIVAVSKTVTGVTRVFVFEITPAVGQVTIYFTRDNDTSIIPSASEVADVKAVLIAIKPATTSDSDVIVSAPTPVVIDFNFSSIVPNTQSMRQAVVDNLNQYFRQGTFVSQDVKKIDYESIIINTVDTVSGDKVQSFSLSTPSGDVAIGTGSIGILGTVTI